METCSLMMTSHLPRRDAVLPVVDVLSVLAIIMQALHRDPHRPYAFQTIHLLAELRREQENARRTVHYAVQLHHVAELVVQHLHLRDGVHIAIFTCAVYTSVKPLIVTQATLITDGSRALQHRPSLAHQSRIRNGAIMLRSPGR